MSYVISKVAIPGAKMTFILSPLLPYDLTDQSYLYTIYCIKILAFILHLTGVINVLRLPIVHQPYTLSLFGYSSVAFLIPTL